MGQVLPPEPDRELIRSRRPGFSRLRAGESGRSLADDDRGCLRLVLAVPLAALTLVAAYFCWTALTITPSGTWDDDAYAGIVLSCVVTLGAAGAVGALRLVPWVRRAVPWWWILPVLLPGVVAGVRWAAGT
ncbi:hypothetical protein [Streptomyces sp. 4F14]|uniref:hypothetical protein n=1 Tax=Streptomyces sp. 4F14 TaxID=3394380 RepID=UPI003A837C25